MNDHRIATRGERLRILVAAIDEEPTMDVRDTFALGLVPGGWDEIRSDDDLGLVAGDLELDVDLAYACAEIAHELRWRQWSARERMDALVSVSRGRPLQPRGQAMLAQALLELGGGWTEPPGEA